MNGELTIKGEVEVLRLQPGDRLIVTFDGHYDETAFTWMAKQMREAFPHNDTIFLANGLRLNIERSS